MAESRGGAIFGVYPQLKGRRTNVNLEAEGRLPLDVARGAVSGVLGMPGDIESLVRLLPGLNETTVLPTSEEVEKKLPFRSDSPLAQAAAQIGILGGGAVNVGPGVKLAAKGVKTVGRAGLSALDEAMMSGALPASPMFVIKNKGGNWLKNGLFGAQDTVDKGLGALKFGPMTEAIQRADPRFVDQEQLSRVDLQGAALDRWIDKKLAKYVRNEMGTPEDPVRLLADRGIVHYELPPPSAENALQIGIKRHSVGMPPKGLAETDLGRTWEQAADKAIDPSTAGSWLHGSLYPDEVLPANPWLAKVPPETPVYTAKGLNRDLGFEHLIDELANATNPESGLPQHLLWDVKDLDKVTVPQAVERVAAINKWRNEQKAAADAVRANNAATHTFKEYPEQGYRWVELKTPKADPKAAEAVDINSREFQHWAGQEGFDFSDPEAISEARQLYASRAMEKDLADALKYEGDTMGHCVGGYCDRVASGKTRIYSLRDKKGEPHVTIETRPVRYSQVEAREKARNEGLKGYEFAQRIAELMDTELPANIIQIKGKGNAKPKDEYIPFVQDFVKSGKWGDVGDFRNTDLLDLGEGAATRFITPDDLRKGYVRIPGDSKVKPGEWVPAEEAVKMYYPNRPGDAENFLRGSAHTGSWQLEPPEGFAGGGLVKKLIKGAIKTAEPEVDLGRRSFFTGALPETPKDLPAVITPPEPTAGIPDIPMSRRKFLQAAGSQAVRSALPESLMAPLAQMAEQQVLKAATRAVKPAIDPAVKTGALNMMSRAIYNNRPYNPNRLDVIKNYAVPEGMTVKEFLRELKKSPGAYRSMKADLNTMTGSLRSRYADDMVPAEDLGLTAAEGDELVRENWLKNQQDKESFLGKMEANGASPATLAREARLWDEHQGNFPYTSAIRKFEDVAEHGQGVIPRVFEPDMGTPSWYKNLSDDVKSRVEKELTGVKYNSAINKLEEMFPQKPKEQLVDFFTLRNRAAKKINAESKSLLDSFTGLPPEYSNKMLKLFNNDSINPTLKDVRRALPPDLKKAPDEVVQKITDDFLTHIYPATKKYFDVDVYKDMHRYLQKYVPKAYQDQFIVSAPKPGPVRYRDLFDQLMPTAKSFTALGPDTGERLLSQLIPGTVYGNLAKYGPENVKAVLDKKYKTSLSDEEAMKLFEDFKNHMQPELQNYEFDPPTDIVKDDFKIRRKNLAAGGLVEYDPLAVDMLADDLMSNLKLAE